MRLARRAIVSTGLGVGLLVAMPLAAENQCVRGLSACVTLVSVQFVGNQLILEVTNNSNVAQHPAAFLAALYLQFDVSAPDLANQYADVEYFLDGESTGGSEKWRVKNPNGPGPFGQGWDLQLSDNAPVPKGGDPALRLGVGLTAKITVDFVSSVEGLQVENWTGQFQGGFGSGFTETVVPEPATVALLASGLLILGGVGLVQRRRGIAAERG